MTDAINWKLGNAFIIQILSEEKEFIFGRNMNFKITYGL